MQEQQVPTDGWTVEVDGAVLEVRRRGAYITRLDLVNEASTQDLITPVVYFDRGKLREAKPTGSHACVPFGPSGGPEGKHGFPRYVDYGRDTSIDADNHLALEALIPLRGLWFNRAFTLGRRVLTTENELTNNAPEEVRTSMAEHLYLPMDGGNLENLRINGVDLTELLGDNAIPELRDGIPQFWGDFDGSEEAVIALPDGKVLCLEAACETTTEIATPRIAAVVWVAKGKEDDFVCVEPTLAVDMQGEKIVNDLAELQPGQSILFETRLRLGRTPLFVPERFPDPKPSTA